MKEKKNNKKKRRNQKQNWIRKLQKVCRSDYDIDYKLTTKLFTKTNLKSICGLLNPYFISTIHLTMTLRIQ